MHTSGGEAGVHVPSLCVWAGLRLTDSHGNTAESSQNGHRRFHLSGTLVHGALDHHAVRKPKPCEEYLRLRVVPAPAETSDDSTYHTLPSPRVFPAEAPATAEHRQVISAVLCPNP